MEQGFQVTTQTSKAKAHLETTHGCSGYTRWVYYPGDPLAQRPHILGLLGLKDIPRRGIGALRPHVSGTLEVEGVRKAVKSRSAYASFDLLARQTTMQLL